MLCQQLSVGLQTGHLTGFRSFSVSPDMIIPLSNDSSDHIIKMLHLFAPVTKSVGDHLVTYYMKLIANMKLTLTLKTSEFRQKGHGW